MTLPVERSRSRRPITWLTVTGVLLLPVVIGALLVAALYNPAERLDTMTAAIVNDDDPVTVDGQIVPLGRQLTAGLVEGSDALDSNLDWVISNTDDAAEGLADGTYSAVVTIPSGFSAAATSVAGDDPEQAVIQVQSSPDAKVVDDAITTQITQAAASLTGRQLSENYLQNVLLGFTDLHDQLGTAASGARQLADGAGQAADGATQLADGLDQLADGAGQLSSGASGVSSGAAQLSSGAASAASGLDTLATNGRQLADGAGQIGSALSTIAGQVPQIPQSVIDAADTVADQSTAINDGLTRTVDTLTQLAADCDREVTPDLCDALTQAAADAQEALPDATGIVDQAGTIAAGLTQFNQLGPGLSELATQQQQIAAGMAGIADGTAQAASGVHGLATGASTLSTGASQLASGASQVASGVSQSADGADTLAGGVRQVADGTASLADGLDTAVELIPAYTDDQAQTLASVVADPVAASGESTNLFGAAAIPLLSMLVLWFGGLGSYVVFQAVSRSALSSRRSSALLALRAYAPGALIGAAQGILVAAVVQLAASYDWADWSLFAALCALAGVSFAAVNQALVAVFGGAGRWISAVVGALGVATGVVSTVPGVLTGVASLMPTSPAYTAFLGALTTAGGVGAGVVGLLVWTFLALLATVLVVARRRKTTARAVLATP